MIWLLAARSIAAPLAVPGEHLVGDDGVDVAVSEATEGSVTLAMPDGARVVVDVVDGGRA